MPRDVDVRVELLFNRALNTVCSKRRKRELQRDGRDVSLGDELDKILTSYKLSGLERRLWQWHLANLEYGCGAELSKVSLCHWDQDDAWAFG